MRLIDQPRAPAASGVYFAQPALGIFGWKLSSHESSIDLIFRAIKSYLFPGQSIIADDDFNDRTVSVIRVPDSDRERCSEHRQAVCQEKKKLKKET